jgi:hypothetical protein
MNHDQEKSSSKDASVKSSDIGSKPPSATEPQREGIHRQAVAPAQKQPDSPAVPGKAGASK